MKSLFYNFSVIALSAAFAWSGAANQDSENCENVQFEGVAQLGFIEVAPGVTVLGALPTPVIVAGVPGLMSSVITGVRSSGGKDQGAQHYTLRHTFVSTDPARPGGFSTEDRAVAAPAGKDPNVSIINDVLTIVSGDGIFENATGFMMNHAIVDLTEFTLTFATHGRICGADL
jgi:hypothetical protein